MSKVYVVGIGPGHVDQMTVQAQKILNSAEVIVGYTRYMRLVESFLADKEIYQTGMHGEVERCKKAIQYAAQEKTVAVISSGDSGVYGMAGLIWELVIDAGLVEQVDVEIVPGIPAANSSAALLGAPIMHDSVSISLSDWLTDMGVIEKRLHCAGEGDFVTIIYNPKSKKRPHIIENARDILLKYKKGDTPVGLVRNAYRAGQEIEITTLKNMCDCEINMLTTIVVGNASTIVDNCRMITSRGYHL